MTVASPFEDGNIKITKAGTYVLSGDFDGQIITEVVDEDVVHLVFNGGKYYKYHNQSLLMQLQERKL